MGTWKLWRKTLMCGSYLGMMIHHWIYAINGYPIETNLFAWGNIDGHMLPMCSFEQGIQDWPWLGHNVKSWHYHLLPVMTMEMAAASIDMSPRRNTLLWTCGWICDSRHMNGWSTWWWWLWWKPCDWSKVHALELLEAGRPTGCPGWTVWWF